MIIPPDRPRRRFHRIGEEDQPLADPGWNPDQE